jgi:hypothetical protein
VATRGYAVVSAELKGDEKEEAGWDGCIYPKARCTKTRVLLTELEPVILTCHFSPFKVLAPITMVVNGARTPCFSTLSSCGSRPQDFLRLGGCLASFGAVLFTIYPRAAMVCQARQFGIRWSCTMIRWPSALAPAAFLMLWVSAGVDQRDS